MKTHPFLAAALLVVTSLSAFSDADIYRWDNGELIPGTEELVAESFLDSYAGWIVDMTICFRRCDLSFADFRQGNLNGANFRAANLTNAHFGQANLEGARFDDVGVFLDRWVHHPTHLEGAIFTDAVISGADFSQADLTLEQLYSTASYQAKDLSGVGLRGLNLNGADFTGQNLTSADLRGANLTGADFTQATLTGADFAADRPCIQGCLHWVGYSDADVSNAVFTDSIVTGAILGRGFSRAQLYSTASYKAQDLHGIVLTETDFSGADFAEQNLSGASFLAAVLIGADLSRANLMDAVFEGWGWGGPTLANASLTQADLTRAKINGLNLKNADLRQANLEGASISSYGDHVVSDLSGANLSGANLEGAQIAVGWAVSFSAETIYNQWTTFPPEFDPQAHGLSYGPSPDGDFDADHDLDVTDVDLLATRLRGKDLLVGYWPDGMFDVNSDTNVDDEDVRFWVKELKGTWFGDADLDGEFNSSDLVRVFMAGEYENDVLGESGWATGDWNADGDFTSSDLVVAFQDGGYELGPRVALASVPEPTGLGMTIIALVLAAVSSSRRRGRRFYLHRQWTH